MHANLLYVGTREHSLTKLNTNKLNFPYSIYVNAWYISDHKLSFYLKSIGAKVNKLNNLL